MNRAGRALAAVVAVAAFLRAQGARAQTNGFALSRFEPSERGSEWFALDSLDLRGHGRWDAGVVADGAYRPLAIYDPNGELRTAVVRHQIFVHPGASVVLWDRVRFGLSVPIAAYQDGQGGTIRGVAYAPPDTPAFGDIRLSGDARLLGEYGGPATLAGGIALYLPTGSRKDFTSDGTARIEPRFLAAGDIAAFTWAARLGFQYRGLTERIDDAPLGSEVTFAAAGGVRVADRKLVIGPEIFGSTGVKGDAFFKMKSSPLDAILGLHWTVADQWRLGAGAGGGLTQGFGSPEARYMISLERVAPFEERRVPADRDGDTILDADDACPDTSGVKTSDPKTNGCPPDRDGDGVLDVDDACPDTAGVKTSDPKTNGCPPDHDGDGVLDVDDACPDATGVKTSDPKTNGCPPDRDADGIPDAGDACPDEPGKPDPDPKKNGCPMVFVKEGKIEILEQVQFKTGSDVILPASDDLLGRVAKILTDHPEITMVLVEGHTDDRGGKAMNKGLSTRRAASVKKWLAKHGIDATRLDSKGFGQEVPIGDNTTDEGRQKNRRVEFKIVSTSKPAAVRP